MSKKLLVPIRPKLNYSYTISGEELKRMGIGKDPFEVFDKFFSKKRGDKK